MCTPTDNHINPLKRKHVTLSLSDKAVILRRLDEGEAASKLALEYDVGKATVSGLKKNRERILEFVSSADQGPSKRKTLKGGEFPLVDSALYSWFLLQEKSRDTPISGEVLKEKARFFYSQLYRNKDDFKASEGWLNKFKKRYGIRYITGKAVLEPLKGSETLEDNLQVLPAHEMVETVMKTDEHELEDTKMSVKHVDAATSFNTCIEWAIENKLSPHEVIFLRQLRNKATEMAKRYNDFDKT